jgi:hypothetical protein
LKRKRDLRIETSHNVLAPRMNKLSIRWLPMQTSRICELHVSRLVVIAGRRRILMKKIV